MRRRRDTGTNLLRMKVTRLSTTPIKGLALHHPNSITIDEFGAQGDRQFFLIDHTGELTSIPQTGELVTLLATYDTATRELSISRSGTELVRHTVDIADPHSTNFFGYKQVAGHLAPGPWDELLSNTVGKPVRLVMADRLGGGHDVEPLSLLSEASTAALSAAAGIPDADARRFRMLIEFDGVEAHAEDAWAGQRLAIGSAVIKVGAPVQRCVATTRNPDNGSVDLRTLTVIGQYRGRQESLFGLGFNFGVYATCITSGVISVGDQLELLTENSLA